MKKWLYSLTGISLIIFIVLLILSTGGQGPDRSFKLIYSCNFFGQCPASLGLTFIHTILLLDYFITLLIFILFLAQGIYYISIKKEKMNKITNWSVGLTLSGLIIFVLTILFFAVMCFVFPVDPSDSGECFVWGLGILGVPFGFAPAGILYLISLLLLVINFFKNKK